MKALLGNLEDKLAGLFKAAPKIPENGRKSIVQWLPWISLIFGVVQLLLTLGLWRAGRRVNEFVSSLNEIARSFGVESSTPQLNVFYWIALVFLAASAVVLLLAYPGLRDRKKTGWNWLFYGALLNVVYGVFSIFFDSYYGGGVSRFIGAVIGTAISFWLLFQVRDHYKA